MCCHVPMRSGRTWQLAVTCALWLYLVVDAGRHRMWGSFAVLLLAGLVVGALLVLIGRDPDGTRFVRWNRVRGTHARQPAEGDTAPPS